MAPIGLGVAALAAASMQHWATVKRYRRDPASRPFPLVLLVAVLLTMLGLVSFVLAALRL